MRVLVQNEAGETVFSHDPDSTEPNICPATKDMEAVSESIGMANSFMFTAMRATLGKDPEPDASEPVNGVTLTP